jgi:hypothetical protein
MHAKIVAGVLLILVLASGVQAYPHGSFRSHNRAWGPHRGISASVVSRGNCGPAWAPVARVAPCAPVVAPCPPQPAGFWEYRYAQVWQPGHWETTCNALGYPTRYWVPGCYRTVGNWVWIPCR